ncbi:hypothetical protein KP509_36G041000 [Ceratopteris richardii]|uniref:Alpha/beta hydrolase fold-3 domain-containing protein n=1 Tax=Ceratopteris richardii TaxID=49495 RepID=A0A8T2QBC2_CERRI|nr:hypothetical protein KP509_36G041000 [Ceratopteris richardii]
MVRMTVPVSSEQKTQSREQEEQQQKLIVASKKEVVDHAPGLIILYSDGSFERPSDLDVPACADFDSSHTGVATRDVVVDGAAEGVWARIFLPRSALSLARRSLPVVLHFHGGGFCVGSPASAHVHRTCARMANKSSCIWISLYYRLAPEHPLPAAYNDGVSALMWLRSQALFGEMRERDPGIGLPEGEAFAAKKADPCFLSGDSAGGTIVHYVAAMVDGENLSPLQIKGMLLIHPAFPQEAPGASVELSNAMVSFYHKSALPAGRLSGTL